MIVFAAFTPHSPLLLPSVNKPKIRKVEKTRQAMHRLEEELYATKPETIVILSSHGSIYEDAFCLHLSDHYTVELKEFGDLTSHRSFKPDMALIDQLQRTLRKGSVPVTISSSDVLNYGAAVPLLMLSEHLPHINVVLISYSGLGPKEHFQFGEALKDVLIASPRRIAVIASGDQSHALTTHSPAGFDSCGPAYDKAVQEYIVNRNTSALLKMPSTDVAAAKECSYKSLLMMLGLLERMNYDPVIHSYEAPFGVGFLVVHFELA